MHMIGHQQAKVNEPNPDLIWMSESLKNSLCNFGMCELICSTWFSANSDEVDLLCRINPQRHFMRKMLAVGIFIFKSYRTNKSTSIPIWHVGRDAALRRPVGAARRPYLFAFPPVY